MQGHRSWVLCVSWSPDAQMIVTGGMDGALWLWDPKTGNSIGCCKGEDRTLARCFSIVIGVLSGTNAEALQFMMPKHLISGYLINLQDFNACSALDGAYLGGVEMHACI